MDGAQRRYDLDWLRIIAFGLLIFYHIGMFYVTWDWHVKSSRPSSALEPVMLLVNPWRMDLLFFISGVAMRFMAGKLPSWKLAGSRVNRLLWPLLFGMAVIVAPQSFYEIRSDLAFTGSYGDFYGKYLTGYDSWCDHNGCLTVPTWNHLWYVAYLLAYSLIFAFCWPVLKCIPMEWAKRLPAWVYVAVPLVLYTAIQWFLQPRFEDTHAFMGDWTVHAHSFGFFLLGVLAAKFDRLFDIAGKSRFATLAAGLAAYALLWWLRHLLNARSLALPEPAVWPVYSVLEAAQAVFLMFSLTGFARRHLAQADGPVRRTLTEAIFPFYIVHQTIIVVAAYHLNRLNWPLPVEFSLLVAFTLAGCWLTYAAVRRILPLRPLFGLPLTPRKP